LKILDYYRVSIYLIIYHMKNSKPLILKLIDKILITPW